MANRPTKRQDKFVKAMADPAVKNQTEAAIKAGFPASSARVTASQLLTNPNIVERIEKRKAEVAQYANVTDAQVLGATALRAFATIDDAFDEQGHFSIEKARETGAVHLIKKIARTRTKFGENVVVEFYSNESAQDRLGLYLGLEKQAAINPNDKTTLVENFIEKYAKDNNVAIDVARTAVNKIIVDNKYDAPLIG